jgi:lysosomal acid lipase/cholesteryl ester hydrolase
MNKHKAPVLLQHGVVLGGDIWFLNLPAQSLGFMLADEGFDVWVANVRGTRWSHGHIALTKHEQQKKNTKKEKNYWDWSWDELAMYDLPAMLEFKLGPVFFLCLPAFLSRVRLTLRPSG